MEQGPDIGAAGWMGLGAGWMQGMGWREGRGPMVEVLGRGRGEDGDGLRVSGWRASSTVMSMRLSIFFGEIFCIVSVMIRRGYQQKYC